MWQTDCESQAVAHQWMARGPEQGPSVPGAHGPYADFTCFGVLGPRASLGPPWEMAPTFLLRRNSWWGEEGGASSSRTFYCVTESKKSALL